MKSKKLMAFVHEILYKNRNPKDNSVLSFLDDTSSNPSLIFAEPDMLFRARVVDDVTLIGKTPGFFGLSATQSFVPPAKLTRDLRANYRYIPYLYCSNNPYVALCEVRPRFGGLVSVATVSCLEPLKIFDFTFDVRPKGMSETKENLCRDFSELFSKPVTVDDDISDYIPTQYIAEYIKNLGYDGIAYQSIYSQIDGKNIVVFNYEKCMPQKSNLYKIDHYGLGCQKVDGDTTGRDILNDQDYAKAFGFSGQFNVQAK